MFNSKTLPANKDDSIRKNRSIDTTPLAIRLKEKRDEHSILCIEGGGTYFRFSVLSSNGKTQTLTGIDDAASTIKVPGGNCNQMDWHDFLKLIENALKNIRVNNRSLATFIRHDEPFVVIGIAGMASQINRQKFYDHCINTLGVKENSLFITSDADIHLARLSFPGAVIIAGTGSVCIASNAQGVRIQTGGLGAHLFGDPGSACAVGRQATLACLNLMNGSRIWVGLGKPFINCDDPLYLTVVEELEKLLTIPREKLVVFLNSEHAKRPNIAALSSIVFKQAFDQQPPSPLAVKIINDIAKELAVQMIETIDAVLEERVMPKNQTFTMTLVGGIFESVHQEKLLALIKPQLLTMCPEINVKFICKPSDNYVSQVVQDIINANTAHQSSQTTNSYRFYLPIAIDALKETRIPDNNQKTI